MDGGRGRPSHFPQEYGSRGRGRGYEHQGLPEHDTMFPPGMGGVSILQVFLIPVIIFTLLTYPFI